MNGELRPQGVVAPRHRHGVAPMLAIDFVAGTVGQGALAVAGEKGGGQHSHETPAAAPLSSVVEVKTRCRSPVRSPSFCSGS